MEIWEIMEIWKTHNSTTPLPYVSIPPIPLTFIPVFPLCPFK
jgi:hypothetical protein